MTKGEFNRKFNVATQVANTAFSKVGLSATKFLKAYTTEAGDLSDELYFVNKDFAELDEQKKAKKDQSGNLIMDDLKEKELLAAVKAWNKEPIEFELDKFIPVELKGKQLFMSAPVYHELNGFVFDVSEEDYLQSLEAEIVRQDNLVK
jgi:hypothetical protein